MTATLSDRRVRAVRHLLHHCGGLGPDDRVIVLSDATTADLAAAFVAEARTVARSVVSEQVDGLDRHGQEPPAVVAERMVASTLILSLCRYSLAHSSSRLDAAAAGARFLSMPLYDWALLDDPCVLTDFRAQGALVRSVADAFTAGSSVHLTTPAGTDLTVGIDGRVGNACPGFVERPGDLGSPPDIEANVSPIETSATGRLVVDGSITCPEIGLLERPVVVDVDDGRLRRIVDGRPADRAELERQLHDAASARRVVAECGVGLNPDARLTGTMLTDEGALGCVHIGVGANDTVGGRNRVDFHLDLVMRDASLTVDGRPILDRGTVVL